MGVVVVDEDLIFNDMVGTFDMTLDLLATESGVSHSVVHRTVEGNGLFTITYRVITIGLSRS